jgi:integral membrane protein
VGEENVSKVATIGALELYLDFINLFLYLLRIFGGNRN